MSIPTAMLVMYLAIIWEIRNRITSIINETQKTLTMNERQGTGTLETAKYERTVLIQAALTCACS
uniref:Uncharacterized protein n=1 Tax=Onchocerca volvulus TaxID=6282 RepID=A0A8R1XRD5_ONCVO